MSGKKLAQPHRDCGHSACGQNYIDTGETRCIEKDMLTPHDALPNWKPYPVQPGDRRRCAKWSGKGEPPVIGDHVTVSVNGIGVALVEGYFTEYGFLGLHVRPLRPPKWYVEQNGRDATCYVFGAELNEEVKS